MGSKDYMIPREYIPRSGYLDLFVDPDAGRDGAINVAFPTNEITDYFQKQGRESPSDLGHLPLPVLLQAKDTRPLERSFFLRRVSAVSENEFEMEEHKETGKFLVTTGGFYDERFVFDQSFPSKDALVSSGEQHLAVCYEDSAAPDRFSCSFERRFEGVSYRYRLPLVNLKHADILDDFISSKIQSWETPS